MNRQILPETHILDVKDDQLGFGSYARALAQLIGDAYPPQTIGVLGDWGSGKTSLMWLCKSELQQMDATSVVWLDAWQYDGSINLLYPLANSIRGLTGDEHEPTNWQRVAKTISLLGWQATSGLIEKACGIKLDVASMKDAFEVIESTEAQEVLRSVTDEIAKLRKAVGELVEEVAKLLEVDRICIFVDDLDRCTPITAITLLENIRIHFDVPKLVIIVGVSRDVIEEAITAKYGDLRHRTDCFIDKLVHLEFPVPKPAANAYQSYSLQILSEAGDFDHLGVLVTSMTEALSLSGRATPRLMKKLVKRVIVLSELFMDVVHEELTSVHMWWLVTKTVFPEFFRKYAENPWVAAELRSFTSADVNQRRTQVPDGGREYLERFVSQGMTPGFVDKLCDMKIEEIPVTSPSIKEHLVRIRQLL